MSKYSQERIGTIFVTQKNLMDKYPENLMKGIKKFKLKNFVPLTHTIH